MPYDYSETLNPSKALIWRIIHIDNLDWVIDNGLHSGNSKTKSSSWVNIGNTELIAKRENRTVPINPETVLNDYVPFYFTPFSPMMLNIHSGRGVIQRKNEEIIILVSSLHDIQAQNIPFVFTDGHAYCNWTNFYSDMKYLDKVDWRLLQTRDFKRDQDDLQKIERYQAEALVYQHLPIQAIKGIICYNEHLKLKINNLLNQKSIKHIQVFARTRWYFS